MPATLAVTRLPSASLSERAYGEIRDRIINLELEPGAPLAEEELMEALDLGRTPVREAIKRLELESLVVIYPRRGTFVSEIQMTDLAAISEVRKEIEGYAAELAAARFAAERDGQELKDLRQRLSRLDGGDVEAMMNLDADVHRFIYRVAGNRYLEETLTRYFNLSFRIWRLSMRTRPGIDFSVAEHERLLGAVEQGAAAEARKVARRHVIDFEKEMRAVL
jgi:DNA-binding GntR family transcriptional regulator